MITKADIVKMIGIVKVHYSFNYKNFSDDDFVILYDSWYNDLKSYDREIVLEAFNRAKKVNRIGITTADIIEQIDRIQEAFQPTPQEMWEQFKTYLHKAIRLIGYFDCRFIEDNGKSQGDNARAELEQLYNSMSGAFKRYCGGVSGLIQIANQDKDQLEYEKSRFLKEIKQKGEDVKIQEQYPLLGANLKLIE